MKAYDKDMLQAWLAHRLLEPITWKGLPYRKNWKYRLGMYLWRFTV